MDGEKAIKGIQECDLNGGRTGNCPYKDVIALMKEQESEIKRLKSELHGLGDLFHTLSKKAEKAIAEQPEIIRCKDCKHWDRDADGFHKKCKIFHTIGSSGGWFCADGEREG